MLLPLRTTTPPYPLTFCGGVGSVGGMTAPSFRIVVVASITSERLERSTMGCGSALSILKELPEI